ncbi:MAG: glycoside hydrolase family 3 C-terminal domain-containing protein [Lewinella sp.]|nr:glycoside hydrolase family 3 C-terminal domain-containing protein [Lewinella sp.]
MMKSKNLLSILFAASLVITFQACQEPQPEPTDTTTDVETRIDSLISQMTLEEKIGMIHASSSFTSGGVPRLGIPELVMSDGPHGVRHEHGRDWVQDEGARDSSTYLPVGTALAATWNPELGRAFGEVLGSEANYRGKDIILGPGLNIIRTPVNGRNFEYMTEDPYLNARMGVGYIQGVQEQGVATCAKHYIANNLEFEREYVNINMSERALREIYLPAFKAAVEEGGTLTVMAAYNKFRGEYCAHNGYLLDDLLRGELGFTGAVISDWNAVKSTMGAVQVGLDLEMGSDLPMLATGNIDYGKFHLGDTLITLVNQGVIEESLIDNKVRHLLHVIFALEASGEGVTGAYNTPEHQATARRIADEAIVLLKNEAATLPLDAGAVKTLAVVGANADRRHAGGGGSSQVKAYYEVTALAGLRNLLGESTEITYSPGYTISRDGGTTPEMIADAVEQVKKADVAIYVGGLIHGYTDAWNDNAFDAEATDKPDMMLPFGQDELIQAILAANPNTIIVLQSGGPVDMRAWAPQAKAIVQAWYTGMEGGNALADILFGHTNPSGKLPMTFPQKLEDGPADPIPAESYETREFAYDEGVFVGYRHYDSYGVEPAFAFGHGLSYTTFGYEDLTINKEGDQVTVSLTLTNTGSRAGAEVVQLYVHDDESSVERPAKELKGFAKVLLEPGQSEQVTLTLGPDAFSFYHPDQRKWVLEPGAFTVLVGSSSRDIRLEGPVEW